MLDKKANHSRFWSPIAQFINVVTLSVPNNSVHSIRSWIIVTAFTMPLVYKYIECYKKDYKLWSYKVLVKGGENLKETQPFSSKYCSDWFRVINCG